MQKRAIAHTSELSVNVYSFNKYLMSVYGEPYMSLDIVGEQKHGMKEK
jgi:hypothetical protein